MHIISYLWDGRRLQKMRDHHFALSGPTLRPWNFLWDGKSPLSHQPNRLNHRQEDDIFLILCPWSSPRRHLRSSHPNRSNRRVQSMKMTTKRRMKAIWTSHLLYIKKRDLNNALGAVRVPPTLIHSAGYFWPMVLMGPEWESLLAHIWYNAIPQYWETSQNKITAEKNGINLQYLTSFGFWSSFSPGDCLPFVLPTGASRSPLIGLKIWQNII